MAELFMDNYIRLFLDDEIFLIAIKNTLGSGNRPRILFAVPVLRMVHQRIKTQDKSIVTLMFYAPSISNVYLSGRCLFSSDQYGIYNAY